MSYKFPFEDESLWKKSKDFAKNLHAATMLFPEKEINGFTSRIHTEAIVISENLALAQIYKGIAAKHFAQAKKHCLLVINLLILCNELGFLSAETYMALRKEITTIFKLLL